MKPTVLLPAALVLAIACVSPALAAPAHQNADVLCVAEAAGSAKADAAAAKTDDTATPEQRLKARLEHVKTLWSKVKGLRSKSKTLTKAELAKLHADLDEARAEAKAGKNLILSGLINKAEKDLDKLKPVDGDTASPDKQ